ncbi:helix-turn-helix domain-containing protein [Microtetraspora sp. NBRC 16547]|uniref:helix-turn-helix domain-containing protein n=1 Tax=Microtetraspora sp. NBRC 16547 TaxID=3030993 RepID=UPI0024A4A941|nr:helix-turn-helix domain-containing protein [Microtetraspora sp. NBRC 16547]GLW97995.1 membrane protein [Microtetraspora sp. NBRC 16547]
MSIGEALAEARERMGMTVSQLSQRTRIRETIIEGMERDDFSLCGGEFYVRGHLRAISRAVGLDPDEMVRQYDDLRGGSVIPVRAASVFKAGRSLGIRGRRTPNWTVALALALAVAVIFGIVRLLGGSGDAVQETAAHSRKAPAAEHDAAKAASDMVVLTVIAKRSSWLDVKDGAGHQLFQGTVAKGKTSTWKARDQVKVVFGDAGAVRLEVNGKDLGTPGKKGEMLRRTYGPGVPGPR